MAERSTDDYLQLVKELRASTTYPLNADAEELIIKILTSVPWDVAYEAVQQLTTEDNPPRNMYNAVRIGIRTIKARKERELEGEQDCHKWAPSWRYPQVVLTATPEDIAEVRNDFFSQHQFTTARPINTEENFRNKAQKYIAACQEKKEQERLAKEGLVTA